MTLNRRHIISGLGVLALTGCATGAPNNSGAEIDQNVNFALSDMYERLPFTRELANQAQGVLVMPGVIKAGFIVGASYGEGALRLPASGYNSTADYYSFSSGSVGWQAGAQKTAHAIFFMTPTALADFRRHQGWEAGADAEVTLLDSGLKADVNTTTAQSPVVAVVFSQTGLLAGASLEGAKYTKIRP
ncbi:MAG: lipid-binding SYLF domain-containing protein [Pseudomonadota bacterium]